jgi:hypothetical protein
MNIQEIERIVCAWPEPWPDYLLALQRLRDWKLDHALSDDDRLPATRDYERDVRRMVRSEQDAEAPAPLISVYDPKNPPPPGTPIVILPSAAGPARIEDAEEIDVNGE